MEVESEDEHSNMDWESLVGSAAAPLPPTPQQAACTSYNAHNLKHSFGTANGSPKTAVRLKLSHHLKYFEQWIFHNTHNIRIFVGIYTHI